MINENFVIVGAFIEFLGGFSYLLATIKGKVKPNRVSFLMWSLAGLVVFFVQLREGVGIQSLMTLAVGLLPLSIFFASFFNKNAEWKLTKFDIACGVLSCIGLVLYLITEVGVVAILFSIIADGLASLPTIKKSIWFPETESVHPYLASMIGAVLTLLTLKLWDFINSAFLIYLIIVCFVILVLVQYKVGKKIIKFIGQKKVSN